MIKNKNKKRKHYLVYQIEDKLNKKIYIGVHTTLKVNDGYMGSGSALKKAISEFGVENFSKTIIYDFDNYDDMLNKEAELVNEEFIKRNDTYNIILGGSFNTSGLVTVKDKYNNNFDVCVDDERYKNGELVGINKGYVIVKDKNDKIFRVCVNDKRYKNGELVGITKGYLLLKDKQGNKIYSNINDNRYLNGELIPIWKDKKHTKETLKKMRETHKNNGHMQGEKNSNYGKCWIYNLELKKSKSIKKEDLNLYLNKNWIKGRKLKF